MILVGFVTEKKTSHVQKRLKVDLFKAYLQTIRLLQKAAAGLEPQSWREAHSVWSCPGAKRKSLHGSLPLVMSYEKR